MGILKGIEFCISKHAGKAIADFDPFKTWTEYLNRLLGVLLGIGIIALFIKSFTLKRHERNLPWFCAGLLFLIIVQGGVGALVVSTHLTPFLITIHMFLAVLLLFGLLYLKKYCEDLQDISIVPKIDRKALRLSKILVAFIFIQILMGTQVRQQVDHLTRDTQTATHENVVDYLGAIFYTHRSFSLIIVGFFLYLLTYLHRTSYNRSAFLLGSMAFSCVLGNIASGLILNYFHFPSNAQPPHLFFGVMSIGFLYSLYLKLKGTLLED